MQLHVINDKINDVSLKIEHARLGNESKLKIAYLNFRKESLLRKRYEKMLQQEKIEEQKRMNREAKKDAIKALQIRYGLKTEKENKN